MGGPGSPRSTLVLLAGVLFVFVVVQVAIAGTSNEKRAPAAMASGLKSNVKKLSKRIARLEGEAGSARPPSGPSGGDLTGTFPNPQIAPGVVGPAEHGAIPAARVYRTTNQQTDAPGNVTVNFDGESFDSANLHSSSDSRLTAPIAGVYLITGNCRWEDDATGERILSITLNGNANSLLTEVQGGGIDERQNVAGTARLAANDYIELRGFENAAAQLSLVGTGVAGVAPALSMVWLAP